MAVCRNAGIKKSITRNLSQAKFITGMDIRNRFLDFFINDNGHSFIRSSPVTPLNDSTLAFVNAGMNQFKEVLLGNMPITSTKVANSQKCIRVGGKHNDLKTVGLDSYHHTFFEMLGNWSFGDYFKRTACEYAWTLLTSAPYSIDPRRLYVTYFSEPNEHGILPDLETKEIWRSLGVSNDHILPFGVNHNLWEMGRTGPCGMCTEIHVDHVGGRNAAGRVNQGFSDVTELWNIVFIQYNRNKDGTLSSLPCHHVDTGMGLERLVALLQNKRSNYDTDLFTPLFDTISKVSKTVKYKGRFGQEDERGLDTAYRVLADHSRMATVAVADNIFPSHNQKLRRVIRRALLVAEESFKAVNGATLMKEVCKRVSEMLSPVFPEIGNNIKKVQLVVDHEWEVMQAVREKTEVEWRQLVNQDPRLAALEPPACGAVGLASAYQELTGVSAVGGRLALKLYETHGLPVDVIEDLSQVLGLEFNKADFFSKLSEAKDRSLMSGESSRAQVLSKECVEELTRTTPVTDDSAKYQYTHSAGQYEFPEVSGVVVAVVQGGQLVSEARPGQAVGLVLDKTCLYCEAGGQQCDRGWVEGEGWMLDCDSVTSCCGYIVHSGHIKSTSGGQTASVCAGTAMHVRLDRDRRMANSRHHTATHCLNAALHHIFTAVHQKGSSVTEERLVFDFATYGQRFTNQHIKMIEERLRQVIQRSVPVTRITLSPTDLIGMADKVTLLPGEIYPSQGINVISIQDEDWHSQEACCGTHVLNTRDLGDFCVCDVRCPATGVRSVTAVAGPTALHARLRGQQALGEAEELHRLLLVSQDSAQLEDLDKALKSLKKQALETLMSYNVRTDLLAQLDSISKKLKESARRILRQSVEEEMQDLLCQVAANTDCRYVVHYLKASSQLDKLPLMKVTKMCPLHLPVLIFAYSEGTLRARCVVPKVTVAHKVSAERWLGPLIEEMGGSGGPPRDQDPRLVYIMRPLRVALKDIDRVTTQAIARANKIAIQLFDE